MIAVQSNVFKIHAGSGVMLYLFWQVINLYCYHFVANVLRDSEVYMR